MLVLVLHVFFLFTHVRYHVIFQSNYQIGLWMIKLRVMERTWLPFSLPYGHQGIGGLGNMFTHSFRTGVCVRLCHVSVQDSWRPLSRCPWEGVQRLEARPPTSGSSRPSTPHALNSVFCAEFSAHFALASLATYHDVLCSPRSIWLFLLRPGEVSQSQAPRTPREPEPGTQEEVCASMV